MIAIADRKYKTVPNVNWDVSADEMVQMVLTLALSRHIPGWPGATDDELLAVAKEIVTALDETHRADAG